MKFKYVIFLLGLLQFSATAISAFDEQCKTHCKQGSISKSANAHACCPNKLKAAQRTVIKDGCANCGKDFSAPLITISSEKKQAKGTIFDKASNRYSFSIPEFRLAKPNILVDKTVIYRPTKHYIALLKLVI